MISEKQLAKLKEHIKEINSRQMQIESILQPVSKKRKRKYQDVRDRVSFYTNRLIKNDDGYS